MYFSAPFRRSPWRAIYFPQYGYAQPCEPNPSLFADMGEKFFGNCVQIGAQLHVRGNVAIHSLRASLVRACAQFTCNAFVIRN
jgi:hypothetical protein